MGLSHKYKQTSVHTNNYNKKYINDLTKWYMLQLDNIYRQMLSNIHPLIVKILDLY